MEMPYQSIKEFMKSSRLEGVCYDIRGPVMKASKKLEEEGFEILKLNIGNPAAFGLNAPEELIHDIILNLREAQGYCDSKGLFAARKAVMQSCQSNNIFGVDVEDIYMGNGVSELISMAMQGFLNQGDEVLIPAPDYPLWTATVTLAGGKAVHYVCDESSEWNPDLEDIRSKISDKTRAIVVINPNNPTGAVYPAEILQSIHDLAAEHKCILFADEIYDKIVYGDNVHIPMASISPDIFCVTFNGLSKSYRAAGFRAGWMTLSGRKNIAKDYREGLDILANMRLCANVPAQFAVQAALGGYQSIKDLVLPGGRLRQQRDYALRRISEIPGITCVVPKGALYLFPKIDVKRFNIRDDLQFVLDLLLEKKLLMVQGRGFNWPQPDHFRMVFLPDENFLKEVFDRLEDFLRYYKQ